MHRSSAEASVRGSWPDLIRICGPRRLAEAPRAEANYFLLYKEKPPLICAGIYVYTSIFVFTFVCAYVCKYAYMYRDVCAY